MGRLRIALGQILVEGGEASANLTRAAAAIKAAGEQRCHLVVLPECLNLGWTNPSAREKAEQIPGAHSEVLARAARESGVWVAAGLVERTGDRIYNAAVLLSPDGDLILHHRKINELSIAHDLYSLGTKVELAETPLGRIGILICADNFPDSLEYGRALAKMGCQLLLSPCAWAVPADHDNAAEPYGSLWRDAYGKLSTAFPLAIVGVSCVGPIAEGPWAGRKTIGCSLAMGPGGAVLAEGPYGEYAEDLRVIDIEIDPDRGPMVSDWARR